MVLGGIIAGVLVASTFFFVTGLSVFGTPLATSQSETVSVQDAENAEITMLAYRVLEYIRDDDFISLSYIVHPEKGVVISPYATINLSTDRQFSVEQIATLDTDTNIYVWGVINGSGEPITLTPEEYFEKFIPAADHMDAAVIGINQVVKSGNALENITEIFPNVSFVDFHIPCGKPADESDWRSLRLGFEEYNGYLRLIAIVYNTWSI